MKKNYIKPSQEVIAFEATHIIAASIGTDGGNTSNLLPTEDDNKVYGESRNPSVWENIW